MASNLTEAQCLVRLRASTESTGRCIKAGGQTRVNSGQHGDFVLSEPPCRAMAERVAGTLCSIGCTMRNTRGDSYIPSRTVLAQRVFGRDGERGRMFGAALAVCKGETCVRTCTYSYYLWLLSLRPHERLCSIELTRYECTRVHPSL